MYLYIQPCPNRTLGSLAQCLTLTEPSLANRHQIFSALGETSRIVIGCFLTGHSRQALEWWCCATIGQNRRVPPPVFWTSSAICRFHSPTAMSRLKCGPDNALLDLAATRKCCLLDSLSQTVLKMYPDLFPMQTIGARSTTVPWVKKAVRVGDKGHRSS